MKKQLALAGVGVLLLALGFFSGRVYEKEKFKSELRAVFARNERTTEELRAAREANEKFAAQIQADIAASRKQAEDAGLAVSTDPDLTKRFLNPETRDAAIREMNSRMYNATHQ
ncbi:hypothetical protein IT570_03460 [Candidatus Sumerlaeota bacterium]|nr:hypothetical protein [Candidatus Sumerlaeota bacterium]